MQLKNKRLLLVCNRHRRSLAPFTEQSLIVSCLMVRFERSIQVEPEWQCWSWFAYAYGARLRVGVRQPVCGAGDTLSLTIYALWTSSRLSHYTAGCANS